MAAPSFTGTGSCPGQVDQDITCTLYLGHFTACMKPFYQCSHLVWLNQVQIDFNTFTFLPLDLRAACGPMLAHYQLSHSTVGRWRDAKQSHSTPSKETWPADLYTLPPSHTLWWCLNNLTFIQYTFLDKIKLSTQLYPAAMNNILCEAMNDFSYVTFCQDNSW